jgi:hypothetical protein
VPIQLQDLYALVEAHAEFGPEDRLPPADYAPGDTRWQRDVRSLLKRATDSEVIRHPSVGEYVFPDNLPEAPPRENRERRTGFWAFFANPDTYRIEDAVRERENDFWTTTGKPVRKGDRVLIWKGKGNSQWRGILACAEVLADPVEVGDEDNPYWIPSPRAEKKARSQLRVPVRYLRSPRLPWSLPDPLLEELPVTTAQGGTVFYVEETLWRAILARLGGWPGSEDVQDIEEVVRPRQGAARRQGFQVSTARRLATERFAMERAIGHYEREGWVVKDVSRSESFDLLCQKGEQVLHVEVKGTTSAGATILLTANEVDHARRQQPHMELFILNGIRFLKGDEPTGGEVRILRGWAPEESRLTALAYQYELPHGD